MNHHPLEQDDKRYLWHPFTQQQVWESEPQLIIDSAEGSYLIDVDGNRYLDGCSSLWVNIHGHQRPEINQAIMRQLQKVAHSTFLGLTHPAGIELAKRLICMAPGNLSRVFYSDTGAAAVEIALKMAFQYWQQRRSAGQSPKPNKTKFVALSNAYHGDTIGAMSVGGIDLFQQTYRPLLFPTLRGNAATPLPLNELEQLLSTHADELAAVIMEPMVQGAAGMLLFPAGYTRTVWELCRKYDILFIADEVATGFGRTGKMFACEHEGVEPDLITLGKGISGGYLPLAATLATEEIYQAFLGKPDEYRTFYHGHTYTANPLACAAGLASLDLFERDRTLEQLQPKIAQLTQGLERFKQLPTVGESRQCGFMVGIDLWQDRDRNIAFPGNTLAGHKVIREARKHGAILRPLTDTVVLMPPLSISSQELDTLLDITYKSIEIVGKQLLS